MASAGDGALELGSKCLTSGTKEAFPGGGDEGCAQGVGTAQTLCILMLVFHIQSCLANSLSLNTVLPDGSWVQC